jgi:hypothetical protein
MNNQCKECEKTLSKRQKIFCSKKCSNTVNGRKTGGLNKNQFTLICQFCNKEYSVCKSRINKSRHCSRKCHNTAISREYKHSGINSPHWKGGIQTYRKFKKSNCETCNSINHLDVHHIDENRYNNNLSNLITLCRSCHKKTHGQKRDINGKFIYSLPLLTSEI